jgi:hypothetical protein
MSSLAIAIRTLARSVGARWAAATAAGLIATSAACTLLLDRSTTQCQSNADCAKFGGHPICQEGACIDSHLGPAGCFYGTPQQPLDLLNQCSTAACSWFDNCQRVRLCGSSPGADPQLALPPSTDAGPLSDAGTPPGGGAKPNCLDPNNGRSQVVYITGSSNFPPLLAKVASTILQGAPPLAPGPTPVFLTTSSCTGVKAVFSPNPADHTIHDPPPGSSAGKYAAYFAADGSSVPCLLGPNGAQVDVGESDVYSTTCDPAAVASGAVNDTLGPIQAMAFVVPGTSTQRMISQQAAREVFGIGGNSGVAAPWTNPNRYYVRNAGTGTQQMIGLAIGVAPGQFWGVDQGSAQHVHDGLQALTAPDEAEQAIGIISVDWYDGDRLNLNCLAYQADGQQCAYLPDSNANSKDKRNVRDGHYPIWGPLHFFTSNPSSAAAAAFLNFLAGASVNELVLDAFISASLVPTCAMTVQREQSVELGSLKLSTPPHPCGCHFDWKVSGSGAPPPGCTPCQGADDCPATQPSCNVGFCEVQPP